MLNRQNDKRITILALLFILIFAAACTSSGGTEPLSEEDNESMEMEEMEHDEGEDMEKEHDDDHAVNRVPNADGASITIISPAEGDAFPAGDQIIIDVEVENFDLSEEGNHWHVYVDGTSYGMVMGGNLDQPLSGIEPGEHEISVFMSISTHEEYEDGDSINIIVEE